MGRSEAETTPVDKTTVFVGQFSLCPLCALEVPARGSPSRSASDKLRRSAERKLISVRECCGSESRGPAAFKLVAADVRRRISRQRSPILRLLTSAATGEKAHRCFCWACGLLAGMLCIMADGDTSVELLHADLAS